MLRIGDVVELTHLGGLPHDPRGAGRPVVLEHLGKDFLEEAEILPPPHLDLEVVAVVAQLMQVLRDNSQEAVTADQEFLVISQEYFLFMVVAVEAEIMPPTIFRVAEVLVAADEAETL